MITDSNKIQSLLSSRKGRKRPSPYSQGWYACDEGGGNLREELCAYSKDTQSYALWMAGWHDCDKSLDTDSDSTFYSKELDICYPPEPFKKDYSFEGWDGLD